MDVEDSLEVRILLRNAQRLGVSAQARDAQALATAIQEKLHALGFRATQTCGHCNRSIPDFGLCPYCSAPRALAAESAGRPHPPQFRTRELISLAAFGAALTRPFYWGVVALATAPMILKLMHVDEKWMFVYFSLLWAYVFSKIAHAPQKLWRPGLVGYAATGLIALPLLSMWISMPPHLTESLIASPAWPSKLAGFVFGVGLREEAAKVVAVFWLLRMRSSTRSLLIGPADALLVGSFCGLGFAAVENMDYLERFQFLDKLHYSFGMYGDNLTFRGSMSRVMLTPFVHAVWAGVFAHFAASAVGLSRMQARLRIAGGWLLAAALHGGYDFFTVLPNGELAVLLMVALSFAFWLACLENAQKTVLRRRLEVEGE